MFYYILLAFLLFMIKSITNPNKNKKVGTPGFNTQTVNQVLQPKCEHSTNSTNSLWPNDVCQNVTNVCCSQV